MSRGLESAGCRILFRPPANQAPFILSMETASGERIGIVAYAFFANRRPTSNRPPDERSFQIKYGNKIGPELHSLWQDPFGLFTTLLLGIDPEDNFFVSADPILHDPTKFFIRLEFKDRHADEILRSGWHAWSRDRRPSKGKPDATETLVGGHRDQFLRLVRFERSARGVSQAERKRLAGL